MRFNGQDSGLWVAFHKAAGLSACRIVEERGAARGAEVSRLLEAAVRVLADLGANVKGKHSTGTVRTALPFFCHKCNLK